MSQMHETGGESLREQLQWDLNDRLVKSLRVSGVGVGDMASVLSVSRNTVGNYLSGRTPIPRASLVAWAVRTGVPLGWLSDGREPPEGPEPNSIAGIFDWCAIRDSNPEPADMEHTLPASDLRLYRIRMLPQHPRFVPDLDKPAA